MAKLIITLVTAIALAGCGAAGSFTARPQPAVTGVAAQQLAMPSLVPLKRQQLPRGGTEIFPANRLFGYCGNPDSEALGRLGIGDLDERISELEGQAPDFAGDRQILPVVELIAVVAIKAPGDDGTHSAPVPDEVVDTYLAAARRHKALLLIDIQPGTGDFLPAVQRFEKYLTQPDVGIALDPEWAVEEGQLPGDVYGSTSGAEIDAVSAYLADLVVRYNLPQKALVFHQVAPRIVTDEADITERSQVAVIKSVDGIGPVGAKIDTYRLLTRELNPVVQPGFKLFFVEDQAHGGRLMTPEDVLGLDPQPQYVLFE